MALVVLVMFAGGSTAQAQSSETIRDAHTEAQLVAAQTAVVPGQTLRVGLRMTMDPHWHTYWINPGDGGMVTRIKWTLPEGVTAGDIRWPTPIKFKQGLGVGYGYEGEALLPVDIDVPADFSGESITLEAKASWLACEDICVPGKAELSLTLPVAAETSAEGVSDSAFASRFAATEATIPTTTEEGFAQAWWEGDQLVLAADAAAGFDADADEAVFFPSQLGTIAGLAEQPAGFYGDRLTLTLTPAKNIDRKLDRLTGLLVIDTPDGRRSFNIDAPLLDDAPALASGNATEPVKAGSDGSAPPGPGGVSEPGLGSVIGYALLGGLILNLMPCVFPVLAIKITGFVQQAGEARGQIAAHGFAFAAGVIVSFWAIAAAVVALQATGRELGWGFQLQSPVFVGLMAVLLFAVGLNFAGVFDLGFAVMNKAGAASTTLSAGSLSGTFGSGVLATALATPCSAPFMTTAVGFALGATPATTVVVLTALGVGMALPYVVLSLFPAWLKLLPRPGAWMETFKQLMAFPMFAVVAYLVWVFNNQTGGGLGLPALLSALIVAALGLWALGRWGRPSLGGAARWGARLACVLLLALSVAGVVTAAGLATESVARATVAGDPDALAWEPYSAEAVQTHLAAGRPVFVDFTADWCATCKFNERVFIDTTAVRDAVDRHDVALLKADWTSEDDDITAALSSFGVRSVPLYVFHSPDPAVEPIHFSSMFSSGKVIDAIEAVAGAGNSAG